jgi:hypothetical protein
LTKGLKSIGLAIPYLDVVLGAVLAGVGIYEFKSASDTLVESLDIPENQLADALSGDEGSFQIILQKVAELDQVTREEIKENFNNFLDALKSLMLTIVQGADSAVVTAAGQVGPQVAVPEELITVPLSNVVTAIAGFVGEMIPIERFLFDMASSGAGYVEDLFSFFSSASNDPDSSIGKEFNELSQEGGSVWMTIVANPATSFRRLGDFYNALYEEGASPVKSVASGGMEKAVASMSPDLLGQISQQTPSDVTLAESTGRDRWQLLAGIDK